MAFSLPPIFPRRDRRLGVADKKRRYDLPLSNSAGNRFLILLVALMTFLAVLALSASFALGEITKRWSSGLENQLTIEIPATDSDNKERDVSDINDLKNKVDLLIQNKDAIKDYNLLEDAEIHALISPWLGDDFSLEGMPLPALIAVELKDDSGDNFLDDLKQGLAQIDETITLDTHEDWLTNILDLIGTLEFSIFFVTLTIAFTGIVAIAGAIRSRMAEHKPDVELLHLMGASDIYISKQFQRHAFILGLQGGLAGLLMGGVMLLLFTLLSGGNESGLLPDFTLSSLHITVLALLPVLACALSSFTARYTVLRELARMP